MLNRQKAELNALMEAHRKQQLEFVGSICGKLCMFVGKIGKFWCFVSLQNKKKAERRLLITNRKRKRYTILGISENL